MTLTDGLVPYYTLSNSFFWFLSRVVLLSHCLVCMPLCIWICTAFLPLHHCSPRWGRHARYSGYLFLQVRIFFTITLSNHFILSCPLLQTLVLWTLQLWYIKRLHITSWVTWILSKIMLIRKLFRYFVKWPQKPLRHALLSLSSTSIMMLLVVIDVSITLPTLDGIHLHRVWRSWCPDPHAELFTAFLLLPIMSSVP